MARDSAILDQFGNRFKINGTHRPDLLEMLLLKKPERKIEATYDAAQDGDQFKNYWSAADSLDADSANSKAVRGKLVPRSRYEVANNGYSDGMVQTDANYLVGIGPKLKMQTSSRGFNAMVEAEWKRWTKAVQFRRKLWTQAHAKTQDGECLGIVRNNPRVRHPVTLDYVLVETEQNTTPSLPFGVVGYIDGIKFDDYGNVEWYDVLPQHPGGQWAVYNQRPEHVPARFAMHWFKMRRPGQHRGVPEFRSTLNCGAQSRRWRESTLSAAEAAAMISLWLQTSLTPDDAADLVAPMTTVEFVKNMMMALPMGWEAGQVKSEHPNASFSEFVRQQLSELGRPKSIPMNVVAADSSNHNFASGKLDHLTWHAALKVDREDGNDLVLDPLFEVWFEEASLVFGWVGDPSQPPSHSWDWPPLPVADEKAKAIANNTRLQNGTISPSAVYEEEGKDFDDEIKRLAADYGVDEQKMRQILLEKNLGAHVAPATKPEESDLQAMLVDISERLDAIGA